VSIIHDSIAMHSSCQRGRDVGQYYAIVLPDAVKGIHANNKQE